MCATVVPNSLSHSLSGHVGMFDATNTTRARRQTVLAHCRAHMESTGTPLQVVFIESICDDPVILSRNYDMKLANDDYKGKDPAAARADFIQRVEVILRNTHTHTHTEERARVRTLHSGVA